MISEQHSSGVQPWHDNQFKRESLLFIVCLIQDEFDNPKNKLNLLAFDDLATLSRRSDDTDWSHLNCEGRRKLRRICEPHVEEE